MQTESFYSQGGEDFLLSRLFPRERNGFFVEVGCIDGRRFSNTLHFEKRGWRGICVEAHRDYISLLEKNRPGSTIVHAAVGERDQEDVSFFANSRGSLSTLDRSKEQEFAEDYGEFFTGFQVQKVPMLSLNTIFQRHGVQRIDILSLDIEGYEVQALKGLDLNRYRPDVFVIESEGLRHRRALEQVLVPAGYHRIAVLDQNLFYSREQSYAGVIADKVFEGVTITHTEHPLDKTGDRPMTIDVSTRESRTQPYLRALRSEIHRLSHMLRKGAR